MNSSSWPCSGRQRLTGFGNGGGRGSGLGLRIPLSGRDGDDDIPSAELSKSLDKDDEQEAVWDRDRKWNMINKYEFYDNWPVLLKIGEKNYATLKIGGKKCFEIIETNKPKIKFIGKINKKSK